jgi:hypothetical protein
MSTDPRIQFNRLLDHRSIDHLIRMNDGDRCALLIELLGQPASESSWQALWELFACWPADSTRADAIEIAKRTLAAWPDRLRFASSSDTRLHKSSDSGRRLSPIAQLVRTVEIYRRNENGSSELQAIAASEQARCFTIISIQRSEIDSSAWRALAASAHLSGLRHLHVRRTVIPQPCFGNLFQSAALADLQCLKLVQVGLGAQTLIDTQQTMRLVQLRELELSSDALGNDGAFALAQASWLSQIRRLTLQQNFIRADGIRALLSSPNAEQLERLDVSNINLDDAERSALIALAASRKIELIL